MFSTSACVSKHPYLCFSLSFEYKTKHERRRNLIAALPLQDLHPPGQDAGVGPAGGEAAQEHRQLLLVAGQPNNVFSNAINTCCYV